MQVARYSIESKGRGFVQFDCEKSATKAIEAMNGKILEGKKM